MDMQLQEALNDISETLDELTEPTQVFYHYNENWDDDYFKYWETYDHDFWTHGCEQVTDDMIFNLPLPAPAND